MNTKLNKIVSDRYPMCLTKGCYERRRGQDLSGHDPLATPKVTSLCYNTLLFTCWSIQGGLLSSANISSTTIIIEIIIINMNIIITNKNGIITRFHAYFPAGNSYPSILADMLSDAIGCVGFSWVISSSSPSSSPSTWPSLSSSSRSLSSSPLSPGSRPSLHGAWDNCSWLAWNNDRWGPDSHNCSHNHNHIIIIIMIMNIIGWEQW